MHPSSSRAFQRDQEHDLKHPSLMDLIRTKQNKQTTLLHKWISNEISFFWAKIYCFYITKLGENKSANLNQRNFIVYIYL
jgi:hypothetical protein